MKIRLFKLTRHKQSSAHYLVEHNGDIDSLRAEMPGNGGGDVRKGKLGDRVGGSWSSSLQTLGTWNCLRDILSAAH